MCKYITRNYSCGCFHSIRHVITCPDNQSKSALKCEVVKIVIETENENCWTCSMKERLGRKD